MSLKFGLSACLLLAASPLAAQTPTAPVAPPPSGPQAEIQRTAMAFGQCVSTGVQNASASVTPEAAAAAVFSGCAAQRNALAQSVNAMVATMPADQQSVAHTQFETQMAAAQTRVADAIRQRRAAPAAPATPTPSH